MYFYADKEPGDHRSRTEESNDIENVNVEALKTAKHAALSNSSARCRPTVLMYGDVIIAVVTVALSRLRHCGR